MIRFPIQGGGGGQTPFSVVVKPGTDSIQAAVDAVETAGGGTVFLRAGTHILTAKVQMKAKVHIVGEGREGTIIDLQANAIKAFDIGSTGGAGDDMSWSHLTVKGTKVALQGVVENVSSVAIDRLHFTECLFTDLDEYFNANHAALDRWKMYFDRCHWREMKDSGSAYLAAGTSGQTFYLVNCSFVVNVSGGIIADGGSFATMFASMCEFKGLGNSKLETGSTSRYENCIIRDCTVSTNQSNLLIGCELGDVFGVDGAGNTEIVGCQLLGAFTDNSGGALTFTGCFSVSGFSFIPTSNTAGGLGDKISFIGCNINGTITDTNGSNNALSYKIENCRLEGNTVTAALVFKGQNHVVRGNTFEGNTAGDIEEQTGANFNTYADNKVTDAVTLVGAESTWDGFILGSVQTPEAAATTIATIPIAADSEVTIEARAKANEPATNDTGRRGKVATFRNVTGTVTLAGAAVDLHADQGDAGSAAWTLTFAVSGTDVLVQVTGEVSHTIDWDSWVKKYVDVL